jgi:cellulose synthase/poly-beta-1,6-N-acetylglucosamine synthase-like glycosyltransferase
LPRRQGKTAAENAARPHLTGEIIVNTDASVRVHPAAVRHLVAAFGDPSVGLASGRDVSVANLDTPANAGEQAYVGYEMWVRDLETRVNGIVGASGCLYAIRAGLHTGQFPDALSRDFAAALITREHGLRAVSVPEAICFVPRGASLRQEYRRKVRTITRGLGTLAYKRALLNPLRYGPFAWMLFSHKVCRWLLPWAMLALLAALGVLASTSGWARAALAAGGALGLVAGIGWLWPERVPMPRPLALPTYLVAGNAAVLHAWLRFWTGRLAPVWEPTRRSALPAR